MKCEICGKDEFELDIEFEIDKNNRVDMNQVIELISAYNKLFRTYKQLKDNWKYIKKMLKEARQEEFNINGYCGTCTDVDIDFLLDKMQELEGSDSNELQRKNKKSD